MNASKENAKKAAKIFSDFLLSATSAAHGPSGDQLRFVAEFLTKAQAKLPTEAAYKADKNRRKKVAA